MLSPDMLCQEQQDAITHIYEIGATYLIGQMGSGKTVVAETAASELLRDNHVTRVLVVAPLRVARDVWKTAHMEWTHLCHLQVAIATGSEKARLNALASDAEIVVINFESLPWFFECNGANHGFDMLVIDESTKMKAGGLAFKKLRKHIKSFAVRVCMSGTPVAESWSDLFYQFFIVDAGVAFGKNRQKWLDQYFYPVDYERRKWAILPTSINTVTDLIAPNIMVLPDYTDSLPELDEYAIEVTLDRLAMDYYTQFERDSVNADVTADTAAVLVNKLQQIASGFIYDEGGRAIHVHDCKLDNLVCSATDPTVFVYLYREELSRLRERFPNGRQLGVSEAEDKTTLALWRSGDLKQLFLHPRSAGHGLDLTAGRHMVIMSPIWSRDLMRQVIARIWRRNQTDKCYVGVLCAKGTIDYEIIRREREKGGSHKSLMARLKRIHGP